jgi:hypothetical protein
MPQDHDIFMERTAHDLFLCARVLATATERQIESSRHVLEEAREKLNDALAKVELKDAA